MVCLVCGSPAFRLLRRAVDVERESLARYAFVKSRLAHPPAGLEGIDLTEFTHGGPAEVLTCSKCGAIRRRDAQPAHYESDRYDSTLLRHLYSRYRAAFERKRIHYGPLLAPNAEVLEVGSHVGAFLETAESWGWKPTGLDIRWETSAFARHQGAIVKRIALADYSPKLKRPDAVFVWNCFEQLEDPQQTLGEARRMLTRHGLVVLRVPNGEFYRRHIAGGRRALQALGYNNMLGFPYLNGYSMHSLERLLRSANFEVIATFATSVLTPPYPEMNGRLTKEWRILRSDAEHTLATDSPWIEVVGRACSSGRNA